MNIPQIILASSSRYRASLLQQLQLPFSTFAPEIDETPAPEESPESMVLRLSVEKADAVKTKFPNHLIIASDQCAVFAGKIIGKPGTHARAVEQLSKFSGNKVIFNTGLVLLNTKTGHLQSSLETFTVSFRTLMQQQIEHYLEWDQPYDCAGSFKAEGLGITLFEKMSGNDPNTLIGLPLIRLTSFLANEGLLLPIKPG